MLSMSMIFCETKIIYMGTAGVGKTASLHLGRHYIYKNYLHYNFFDCDN